MDKPCKVAAHQPNFLPWAGFWHKVISADLFIVCTGIQYSKRSFSNRTKFSKDEVWATVPVTHTATTYEGVKIANQDAVTQIGRRLLHWGMQKRYTYRDRLSPVIERLLNNKSSSLTELNLDLIYLVAELLGEPRKKIIVDRSDWTNCQAKQKIPQLINQYGTEYLAGKSSLKYLSREDLSEVAHVHIQTMNADCPPYSVLHLIASKKHPRNYISRQGSWSQWLS